MRRAAESVFMPLGVMTNQEEEGDGAGFISKVMALVKL